MSDTLGALRGKISGAEDMETVVRSMKSLAASMIGQYEKSVLSVADYAHMVELSLFVCLRHSELSSDPDERTKVQGGRSQEKKINAVVFGSDQGLVGQFNDVLTAFVVQTLASLPGEKSVWAVGDRVHASLADAGLAPVGLFDVPTSVDAITPLVSQILIETAAPRDKDAEAPLYLFHNRPQSGTLYAPQSQRVLPLDEAWWQNLKTLRWPDSSLPEVLGDDKSTLLALVDEYFFVSLFRACAESLASENASRLAAMQRAEENINTLLGSLHQTFNRRRQGAIDEEMFDVLSGAGAQMEGQQ
jgi:F-type H+-transporting ATPase subunit gamma